MQIIAKFILYCNLNKGIKQVKSESYKEIIKTGVKFLFLILIPLLSLPITIYLCRLALTI